MPQSTIFRIQNGLTENPRQSTLKAISDWSGVDVGDLLTKDLRLLDLIPNRISIDDWDSNTPLDDDEVEIPFFKDFSFACGSGSISEAIANETRKLRMSKATLRNLSITKDNAVAASAIGDSMNPTIKDGDTIHVDLGRKTIKDGKIFAICIGGLFYCKRLYNLPFGGVRIASDNSEEFPEIQLTAEQIIDQDFQIVGWVWQISSLERW
ncbi:peptidase S24 [Acinetobacter sp. ANC 4558]|nr:peptidase S24 [Acinetobacter sp. ANC 4558]